MWMQLGLTTIINRNLASIQMASSGKANKHSIKTTKATLIADGKAVRMASVK
jgi:hypothetical protein